MANVAGTREPIYGPSAIQSVAKQAETTPYTELSKDDLKWAAMQSTCVETQTFYLTADNGHYGMAQVIYSNVGCGLLQSPPFPPPPTHLGTDLPTTAASEQPANSTPKSSTRPPPHQPPTSGPRRPSPTTPSPRTISPSPPTRSTSPSRQQATPTPSSRPCRRPRSST